MTEPKDEFDRIVEGLELDLSFTEEIVPEPEPEPAPPRPDPVDEYDADEVAYRIPPPRTPHPPSRARMAAWIVIVCGPMLMVAATVAGLVLPRPVVVAASLIFVAAVIYLISRLPEHGPSHPDWPDDGAVL